MGGGGGGGVDVFEVPYITAKIIFAHCSQFHNCIPYTDKKSFTFNTQSHIATFFSQNCVYFPLILAELRPSRRKFNDYSDTVCQTYFIDENALRKKSIFTSIQSTTLPRIILRSFYSPFAITTSGFYFRN